MHTNSDFLEATEAWLGPVEIPQIDSYDFDNPSGRHTESPHIKLQFGELRLIGIANMQTTLLLLRATVWRLYPAFDFHREEQLPYFTHVPESSAEGILHGLIDSVVPEKPDADSEPLETRLQTLKEAITTTLQENSLEGMLHASYQVSSIASDCWRQIITLAHGRLLKREKKTKEEGELLDALRGWLEKRASATINTTAHHFWVECWSQPDYLVFGWQHNSTENLDGLGSASDFLAALIGVAKSHRTKHRVYGLQDRLAFHVGYYLLSQGQNPFNSYECRTLGTVGFRKDSQTYLSLTDPGPGHVFGTTGRESWTEGATVHVEHLERPAGTTRAQIESYRIPSVLEFARVCLHTGYAAPNSCYIGRPLQDSGDLKYDFIKVVDTVASACSSMFQLGSAECKIAMSSLKASDMIAYMRALQGHTLKNYRQCFSAAFNLNTPLVDDIQGRYFSKPMDIALRAIELTVLGGFDKVTWDGASDSYPSVPLLQLPGDVKIGGLLNLLQAKELVHRAHSVGLLTYFSAGFKLDHIQVAVYSGVDGIGIGGAQVLRTMDPKTGMHGEYLEWRIDELIAKRNEAAQDTFGKAASLLARLDQMYYEGSLNSAELQIRNDLYETLATKQPAEKDILDLLAKESNVETVQAVLDIKGDLDEPWTALANRLMNRRHGKPSLLEECQGNQGDWSTFESILKRFLDRRAAGSGSSTNRGNTSTIEGDIHSFSMSPHWKRLNANYREWLKENAQKPENNEVVVEHYRGELDLNIKATPFENSDSPALADLKKHFKAYEVE